MCGICGVIRLDKTEFPKCMKIRAIKLLEEIESRGRSAFGFYVLNPEYNYYITEKRKDIKGHLFKIKGSVTSFFKDLQGEISLDGVSIFLGHTRAPTSGSTDNNENNHPFMTKDFILAHNGTISNDKELKEMFKLDYESECDSAVIIHLIQHFYDKYKDVVKAIQETTKLLSGSYACWLYHKKSETVYLFRHSNPICYYIDKRNRCLLFASEQRHIDNVYDKKLRYSDIPDIKENTIYMIDEEGIKEVGEFETSYNANVTTYRGLPSSYSSYSSSDTLDGIDTRNEDLEQLKSILDDWKKYRPDDIIQAMIWEDGIIELIISSPILYNRIAEHEQLAQECVYFEPNTAEVLLEIRISELKSILPSLRYVFRRDSRDVLKENIENFTRFLEGTAIYFIRSGRGGSSEYVRLIFGQKPFIKRLFEKYGLSLRKDWSIEIELSDSSDALYKLIQIMAALKLRVENA